MLHEDKIKTYSDHYLDLHCTKIPGIGYLLLQKTLPDLLT